jgi:hypothetical protein
LIQNADDSAFDAVAGANVAEAARPLVPELELVLRTRKSLASTGRCRHGPHPLSLSPPPPFFFCSSNERGFSSTDVRAICDLNKSTKALRADATGHKGIGFKSVFLVTNRPAVLSGGFTFEFRADPPIAARGNGDGSGRW